MENPGSTGTKIEARPVHQGRTAGRNARVCEPVACRVGEQPHHDMNNTRLRMTTTNTDRPASSGVAWGPVLWIVVLHTGALLAFFPQYFSWTALGVCLVLHWLTGGIGICMTYHRLLTH